MHWDAKTWYSALAETLVSADPRDRRADRFALHHARATSLAHRARSHCRLARVCRMYLWLCALVFAVIARVGAEHGRSGRVRLLAGTGTRLLGGESRGGLWFSFVATLCSRLVCANGWQTYGAGPNRSRR